MSIITLIFGLAAIILQTVREYISDENKKTKKRLLLASSICIVLVTFIGSYSQHKQSEEDKRYKSNQAKISVFEDVDGYRISILNNITNIAKKFYILSSYSSFVRMDKKEKINKSYFEKKWYEVASDKNKEDISSVEQSLVELKNIALQILNKDETYPKVLPINLVEWASKTVKIKLYDLEEYVDPTGKNEVALKYTGLIGSGFIKLKKMIRKSSGIEFVPNINNIKS